MSNISISDNEGLSYDEINKKLGQLERYIERVGQRLNVFKNHIKSSHEEIEKVENIMKKMTKHHKVRVKK